MPRGRIHAAAPPLTGTSLVAPTGDDMIAALVGGVAEIAGSWVP
ncbi:hypothetical protein PE067_09585 [Paracoccus sp. DMF-8]|nr:hypothetical protein [Paracoccus sp. DMF-8]MDF3606371.1 hypothetical protein [Paracoccus sp. DMF-8]